jgi:hypothetical protein
MYLSCLQNWYTEERWFTWEENGKTIADTIISDEARIPVRLTVVNGSTLPVSRVQQREEALVLYEKGAIDQQDLLEKLDWSGRAELLERMQKGPMGTFLNRLGAMGAPEELLGIVEQLSTMDDKDFQKALEAGKIPALQWPGQEGADTEETVRSIEIQKRQEEIRTERAKRIFVEEQTNTEREKQREIAAGIEYDRKKLNIERANAVAALHGAKVKDEVEATKSAEQNDVHERGLKTNNRTD